MGNVSKKILTDNMKRTWLYRYVYDFLVDYDSTGVAYVLDIYNYLMAKNNLKQSSGLFKQVYIFFIEFQWIFSNKICVFN